MDKNTITGFVLIALVLIGFGWYNQPSAEQIAEAARQDSIAQVERKKSEAQQKQAEAQQKAKAEAVEEDSTSLFYTAKKGTSTDIILKNTKLEVYIPTKGGTVAKAVIKNFKDREGNKDVTLFDKKDQTLRFMFEGKEENISTADLFFTPSAQTDTTVTMTAVAAPGKELIITYSTPR